MKSFHCALVTVLLALHPLSLSAQPKLLVEGGTKRDFGTIFRGDIIKKEIRVRNAGSDTLILYRVIPSCGCTGAVASGDRIPAGKSGTVDITFNSQNFTGTVHKSITIETNAPDSPRTVVEFTAEILDEVSVTPSQCFFKDAEVGKTATAEISVKNAGSADLRLTGYRTELKGFTLAIPDSLLKPGATVRLTASFTPSKPQPVLYDALFITTTNPRRAELYVPIYGNVGAAKAQ